MNITNARVCASAFGLLGLLAAGAARADEAATQEPIEKVIVTGAKGSGGQFGAKSGIPLQKVPQGVQVVTSEDLEDRNARSVGDALRAVPSANVGTPRTSAYQSFSLKVRGFLADQMRNGVRQRYYEDVDASALSNIERIEVLKGPSSVLFGQSALGGVISIITKRPEREFSAEASAVVGSYEQFASSFDVTGPISEDAGLFFRATGEIERSGTFVDFQDIDRENAALSLTWAPSDDVTAYFVGEWLERRTQRNPGLPLAGTVISNGVAPIPIERFLGDPGRSDLEAFSPLLQGWVDIKLGENWQVTPRLSYSELDTNFTQLRVRDVQADGVTVNRTGRFGKEDDTYLIAQLDVTGTFDTFGIAHKVLLGVEYDRERSTFYQEDIAAVPTINALSPVYGTVADRPYPLAYIFLGDLDGWAAYAQDIIDLTEHWNVVAGVRLSTFDTHTVFSPDLVIDPGDIVDDEIEHTTFQIGSTYRLNESWSLFGGYATGFDMENVQGGRAFDGTPFDPEESDQIEAGLRFSGAGLRASASVFEITRKNVLTADPINAGFSIQTGEVRVRGLEIEGEWDAGAGLGIQGGYAYLDGEITKSNNGDQGQRLADAPEHQANIFVRYEIPGVPLELRGGANYVGERPFSNAAVDVFNGRLASTIRLPDYVTVDIGATLTLDQTRIALNVANVFDERFFTREFNDFSVFPGEPRQVSLRVTQSF